jgi:hypothetical protein
MTYALLDDGFYDHPKFAKVPEDLVGIWAKGLAYCNRHLTDGKIPRSKTRSFCVTVDPDTVVSRMVAAGLWEEDADDVWHVGYLDHNPSRAQVKAKLKKAKARKDKWREKNETTRSETRLKTVPEHVPERVQNGAQSNPIQSDPNTPIGPHRESVREIVRAAYAEGALTVLGGLSFSVQDSEAEVIVRVVADSPRLCGLRGEALATAIRNSAATYVRARRAEAKFERGFTPTKWAEWLRTDGAGQRRPGVSAAERETKRVQLEALKRQAEG